MPQEKTGALRWTISGHCRHQPGYLPQKQTRFHNVAVAQTILDVWAQLTPRLRSAATEALFARRERLPVLLAAIDDGTVRRSQLDPARIQMLLAHPDRQIRDQALELLGDEAIERK